MELNAYIYSYFFFRDKVPYYVSGSDYCDRLHITLYEIHLVKRLESLCFKVILKHAVVAG